MANISEEEINPKMMGSVKACAQDALKVLGITEGTDPKAVVEAIDAFVYAWQKGTRPSPDVLADEDAPFIMGSLWGEQLVARFGWEWKGITFHDHGNSKAVAVVSPDRSLAIYPLHFLMGALRDARVDATIALTFNMLDAGFPAVPNLQPRAYVNVMDHARRIVPRD